MALAQRFVFYGVGCLSPLGLAVAVDFDCYARGQQQQMVVRFIITSRNGPNAEHFVLNS